MKEGISIHQADPRDDSAATLIRALAEEESVRYADLGPDTFDSFTPDDVLAGRGVLVIAQLDGDAVGCGALRQMDPDSAEVNRMYVAPTLAAGCGARAPHWIQVPVAAQFAAQGFRFRKLPRLSASGRHAPRADAVG